jgi:hypothetical protein
VKVSPPDCPAGHGADNRILEKTITLTSPQKKAKAILRIGVLMKKLVTLYSKTYLKLYIPETWTNGK